MPSWGCLASGPSQAKHLNEHGPLGSLERPPGLTVQPAAQRSRWFVETKRLRCCSEPPAPPSCQPRTVHTPSLDDTHTPEGLPLVCGVPRQGAAGLLSGAQGHPDHALSLDKEQAPAA